jgi:hypothetical protein
MRHIAMSLSLFLVTGCMGSFKDDFELDVGSDSWFDFEFDVPLGCSQGELDWSCVGRHGEVATGAMWVTSLGRVPAGATLVSDAPAVVSVEALGDQRYAVRAERPGAAALEILTSEGAVFDAAQLVVTDAVSLELRSVECRGTHTGRLDLLVGDSCHLMAVPLGANDGSLFAGTNAEWSPSHHAPVEPLREVEVELLPHGSVAVGSDGSTMRLDAIAEGPSLVGCRVAGVFAMRTIRVTDPDAPDVSVDGPDASVDRPDASVDHPDAAVEQPDASAGD